MKRRFENVTSHHFFDYSNFFNFYHYIGGNFLGDSGELIGDGGNLLDDGGNLLGDGGDLLGDGGNLLGDDGNLFGDGGDLLRYGGDLLGDGGKIFGKSVEKLVGKKCDGPTDGLTSDMGRCWRHLCV